ncbi:hypothetical protein KORDIASMS9_04651 [Kordia sp. SMS9]|uniref:hypothetical protein n=1 Tax=Kordia sp. SMS9 TaxID=2282170 RepID=UPI000E0D6FBC|nr:hypothetical protein [Kordia sp. SMS9]AXG72379.1 hypothetical protein KORDIASMS9_04651 [Kordia sp. SMS9]
MSNTIIINRKKHTSILADHRVDPVTKKLLKVGDEVCVCAVCKTVYLHEVWENTKRGQCCKQTKTLAYIPNTEYGKKEIPTVITKSYINHFIVSTLIALLFFSLTIYWYSTYNSEHIQKETAYLEVFSLKQENQKTQNYIQNLVDKNSDLQDLIESNKTIIVSNISFQQDNKAYGSKIYSNVKYVYPRITYLSPLYYEKELKFKIKIFKPDGTLMLGTSSPMGYSYIYKGRINTNKRSYKYLFLNGWGNKNGNAYEKGIYTFELWLDEKRLHSTKFQVH